MTVSIAREYIGVEDMCNDNGAYGGGRSEGIGMDAHLRALGYSSINDYLKDHSGEPYSQRLAAPLGVSPVELVRLHLAECNHKNLREIARDVLIRPFSKTQHRLLIRSSRESTAVLATLSLWQSMLRNSVAQELRTAIPADLTLRISRELEGSSAPGWTTDTSAVSKLVAAFETVWA